MRIWSGLFLGIRCHKNLKIKMKKDTFFEELLEWMEIESVDINENTVFKELKDFDSLSVMSIVAYSNEKFGKALSAVQLQKMKTVRDLMELIGIDNFD